MTWLGWIGTALGNFWTSGPRWRLHRAPRPAGAPTTAATRRRVAERYGRSYPASAARLQVDLLLHSLQAEDVPALRLEAATLAEITKSSADKWNAPAAAAALGTIIHRLQAHGGSEGLRLALAAFADLRRHSPEPVPEAMPLLEAAGQRGLCDPATARGYVEYLWASSDQQGGSFADAPARAAVLAALQAACQPARPEADRLNRLVSRWLELPWANLNLLHWHAERKQFAEAAGQWQTARARGYVADDPELLARAGAIHRQLGLWDETERIFAECLTLAPADSPRHQSAEVFHLEAQSRRIAAELGRGQAVSEQPFAGLHAASQSLYARHRQLLLDADTDLALRARTLALAQHLFPVLLDLDSRLNHPRAAIVRAFAHPAEFNLNGHGDCLDHVGQLDAAKGQHSLHPGGARRHGLALLGRGHLHDCQELIEQLRSRSDAPAAELRLLEARLALRSGQVELARECFASIPVEGLPMDLMLPLEIELALAERNLGDAQEALAKPAAALLTLVERELLQVMALGRSGDWRETFARMQQLLARISDSPQVLAVCGWESLFAGQDELACECFCRTLALDPAHHDARLGHWLAAAQPDPADPQQLQTDEPHLSALVGPRRERLASAGRHDLVARLDQNLIHDVALANSSP